MVEIYRTLVIRYSLRKLRQEEREAVLKLVPRLDALGNLWARDYTIYPPDIQNRFIREFAYFRHELKFGKSPKRWFCHVHAVLNVGVRISNERDRGEGVFIDLRSGTVRLRGFLPRRAVTIPLPDSARHYILERLSEGARAKLARVYINRDCLCIAVVFAREAPQPYAPASLLVVDVNSLRHGIVYAVVTSRTRDVRPIVRKPNLRKIEKLYAKACRLEKIFGHLKRLGLHKTPYAKKIRREAKNLRRKIYTIIRDFVNKLVHEIVTVARSSQAAIIVDDVIEESRRELLEEKLDNGLVKLYLAGLRRFVKLLENQAKWYGIPFEKRRLLSTICPRCGVEMVRTGHRRLRCPKCGQVYDRDLVPILHVLYRLTGTSSMHLC